MGIENKWRFAKWALKLDELRADPEPAITEAMGMMFPECPWPPPSSTTFGPQRLPWVEAMAMAKEAMAGLDLAGASGGGAGSKATAARVVMQAVGLGLRAQSMAGRRRR